MADNEPKADKQPKADKGPNVVGQSSAVSDATEKIPYPKCVLLILSCELCERFSYYGMRAVLNIYFLTVLHLSENHAGVFYHLFIGCCYLSPIFGGCISDNWLGTFKTIFYISIIYASGQILMCVGSAPIGLPKLYVTAVSLILIAVGTGGIKPCVAALGGDQFTLPQQEKHLDNFFFLFYFSINVGSALSTFITPALRAQPCLGEETCFPLAFGVPAVLMVIVIIMFVLGKSFYKIRSGDRHGLYKKCHHPKGERVQHWLDRTEDKFDKELITDIKSVFRIVALFVPGIFFWALYDQSSSMWTFQACRMDGSVGSMVILPDQMQSANAILILIMIPLFNFGVYPLLLKMGLLKRQLSRMCCGGFLLTISFVIVGTISTLIEAKEPVLPKAGASHLRIYNSLKCTPTITSSVFDAPTAIDSMDFAITKVQNVKGVNTYDWTVADCNDFPEKAGQFSLEEKKSMGYYLSKKGMISFEDDDSKDSQMGGQPKLRVLIDNPADIKLELKVETDTGRKVELMTADKVKDVEPLVNDTVQFMVRPGKLKIMNIDKVLHVKPGGVYVIFLETEGQSINDFTMVEVTRPNQIHILWQLPQYIILTAAEIMFSISSLEFAYTEAPVSMKSFVQALSLITTFFGNIFLSIYKAIAMFKIPVCKIFLPTYYLHSSIWPMKTRLPLSQSLRAVTF